MTDRHDTIPAPPPEEHETGLACPLCSPEDEPGRTPHSSRDGVCPACAGAGWLSVTQWRACKLAGMFPRP